MKTEQEIRNELNKHIARKKLILNDPKKVKDRKLHEHIISTLEWVLGGKTND